MFSMLWLIKACLRALSCDLHNIGSQTERVQQKWNNKKMNVIASVPAFQGGWDEQ